MEKKSLIFFIFQIWLKRSQRRGGVSDGSYFFSFSFWIYLFAFADMMGGETYFSPSLASKLDYEMGFFFSFLLLLHSGLGCGIGRGGLSLLCKLGLGYVWYGLG